MMTPAAGEAPDQDGLRGPSPSWVTRYGDRHRWARLDVWPAGLAPPRKVRVYRRAEHFLLNWWDPGTGKNQSERVNGDLLAALSRARQIDERLLAYKTAGTGTAPRIGHGELVDRFLADLGRRSDAGEVSVRTVRRYAAALAHYRAFCADSEIARRFPTPTAVSREFRLAFAAALGDRPGFVLDVVRAVFEWAADPDRGQLLPEGFRNPFLRAAGARSPLRGDPLAPPDVTVDMAVTLIQACDRFQLRLLGPLVLFGLRAAEPCHLFTEHVRDGWLRVPCLPAFDLWTKGKRDKSLPLIDDLAPLWYILKPAADSGLLFERRAVGDGRGRAPLRGRSPADLAGEYRKRLAAGSKSAADRARVRESVFREAGGLTYDDIRREFRAIAGRLGWPAAATVKDLRHLFATTMNDGVMPDGYRRYLLGHSPGRAAVSAYTHLARVREVYSASCRAAWPAVIAAVNRRAEEVG
jgi:hypothetical protein